MTTADEVRARLEADLRTAYMIRQAERPDGLTASSVGGCSSYAARTLLAEPLGDSNDFWRALRGVYVHAGLADDLALVDPGFVDGRTLGRFTWDPGEGLPVISGEGDFALDRTVAVELKTRPKAECRWLADHHPSPQECMQVAMAAAAWGVPEAAVVYVPTDGGWDEAAVKMVNVAHWTAEARAWLRMVDVRGEYEALRARGVPADRARAQVLDPVPRDKPYSWCKTLCPRLKACRGDYVPPPDLEFVDPVLQAAAQEAAHWRSVRLDADKREKAAKAMLVHAEGTVHEAGKEPLRVTHQDVPATAKHRAHRRTIVEPRQ